MLAAVKLLSALRIKKKCQYTVDSRYLDFVYLEWPLISKSGPCLNIKI